MEATIVDRPVLIRRLAEAAESGYLGLFIGTGLSRDLSGGSAPSFRELLERLPVYLLQPPLKLDSDSDFRHRSFPQIASALLARFGQANKYSEQEAGLRFREAIANVCNLRPSTGMQARYCEVLSRIRPAWVITTNYDLMVETLFPEHESIGANQPLVPRTDRVPILHLHGHRLEPSTIRVTEEDYAEILGPLDYQRLRLPLLFAESATLMVGYSLGDLNVRAAIQWAHSFGRDHGLKLSPHQGLVAQVLFKPVSAVSQPYPGPAGQLVVESEGILHFLEELVEECERLGTEVAKFRAGLQEFSVAAISGLDDDPDRKLRLLDLIELGLNLGKVSETLNCIDRQLEPIWSRAREDQGWPYYAEYVSLLIDILKRVPFGMNAMTAVGYFADALESVSWYVDHPKTKGTAWKATDVWIERGKEVPDHVRSQLLVYAKDHGRTGLLRMLGLAVGD